jgi:DNA-binding NarL/FixJ family response regulator
VSGHGKQLVTAGAGVAVAEFGVVAVIPDGASEEAVAALKALDLDLPVAGSVEELAGASPALAIVFAPGTIAAAVAEQLPSAGEPLAETPMLMVCDEVRPGEIRGALAAGVAGVVLAGQVGSHLLPCLEAVLSGQICVPRAQARQVEPARLSPREKQILGLVVMGYMNGQIGEQLFVAESTVKSHLSSAFAKLGVSSRSEAVELIVDPERGLGTGILALGGEPLEAASAR